MRSIAHRRPGAKRRRSREQPPAAQVRAAQLRGKRSSITRYRAGQFDIETWNDLWGLLTTITLRKCVNRVEYFQAECRDVRREVRCPAPAEGSGVGWEALDRQPTPLEAAVLTETVEQVLSGTAACERYLARFPQYESELCRAWEIRPSAVPSARSLAGRDFEGEKPSHLGKYELLEVVGRGAFGLVYRARDRELDRTLAIKVPRLLASPEETDRFLREARSAAQLQHPHIVPLHDVGESDGRCFLVYEFVEGPTLAERLTKGRLSFAQAAELLAQTAEALDYAHQRGVIHRDLKPSNILLDKAGRPHITDFGLAKRESGENTLAQEGEVLGTPAYMSPEQARGEAHCVDARSDVYSLGVILYELLTGEVPFM